MDVVTGDAAWLGPRPYMFAFFPVTDALAWPTSQVISS